MNPWLWLLWATIATILIAIVVGAIVEAIRSLRRPPKRADETFGPLMARNMALPALEHLAEAILDGRVTVEKEQVHRDYGDWKYRVLVDPKREEV